MPWRRVAVVLIAVGLAGCGGSRARAPVPSTAPLDPQHLRPLPAQGLLVREPHALAFVGLDGKSYGRLVGFHTVQWASARSLRDVLAQELSYALPAATLLLGPHDSWYSFDALSHRLLHLDLDHVPLPGGATLAVRGHHGSHGAQDFDGYTVTRHGRALLHAGALELVLDRYLESHGTLVDLVTGTRRTLPADCTPVDATAARLLAVCGTWSNQPDKGLPRGKLVAFGAGGQRTLATLPLPPQDGSLSPDGRSLAVNLQVPCGPPYAVVVPAGGGQTRFVSGERSLRLPQTFSNVLGWASDGRLVANIDTADCMRSSRHGIYLVDPHTFRRTLVTRRADAMWGAQPSEG